MKPFKSNEGRSGIVAYDYDDSRILVKFSDNVVYECRKERIGESAFQQMIELADQGSGLNGFIMRNSFVRKGYSGKRHNFDGLYRV